MSPRAILITGATGKQGGSVVDALLKANADFEIIALTRNAQSPSSKKLQQKSPNIKIITGNLDDVDAVFQQAKQVTKAPIWGVFSVQVAMGSGQNPQTEERQGKALVDAALAHNVSHFVYSSVDRGGPTASNTNPTYVPHFASKYNVEQHLFAKAKGSDMTWTVLRPVAFYDNLTPDFMGKYFATTWQVSLAKDAKLQLVATSDIGWFASQAFLKPEAKEYRNESISLAGAEMTFGEYKETFERQTGQKLPTTFRLVSMLINWMIKELGTMWRWFREVRYGADIAALKAMNPELKDFATWLETESAWKSR